MSQILLSQFDAFFVKQVQTKRLHGLNNVKQAMVSSACSANYIPVLTEDSVALKISP